MSVVTALSLVLFVGFVATGLVGFLGWRNECAKAQVSAAHQPQTVSRSTR